MQQTATQWWALCHLFSAFYSLFSSCASWFHLLENPLTIEEDILRCDSYQLSLALCRFIREVRRPNGESYSPDSTFYLCLGIQQVKTSKVTVIYIHIQSYCSLTGPWFVFLQYLFMKGRIENIFTDQLYSHFASDIAEMLKQWKPTPPLSGMSTHIQYFIHPEDNWFFTIQFSSYRFCDFFSCWRVLSLGV